MFFSILFYLEIEVGNLGEFEGPAVPKRRKNATKERIEENKRRKYGGDEHHKRNGEPVPSKNFVFNQCDCKRLKCSETLDLETRKQIFKDFNELQRWDLQSTFIHSNIKTDEPKTHKVRLGDQQGPSKSKSAVRVYSLKGIPVCKTTFLSTLGISSCRVNYLLHHKISDSGTTVSKDNRGNHNPKELTDGQRTDLQNFFDNMTKYQSHYSDSGRLYVPPGENGSSLFDAYKKSVTNPVCEDTFRRFLRSYDVSFYVPRSDTCSKCDVFKVSADSARKEGDVEKAEALETDHMEHLYKAKYSREALNEAKKGLRSDTLAFSFDLEKTLPLPYLRTSVAFYSRCLWVYNLGINILSENKGIMCMWEETSSKRGSQEVASSVEEFLRTRNLSGVMHLQSFSDGCIGQNKNKYIVIFLFYFINESKLESWTHTYMESGHSYLPNDTDFGFIERIKNECEKISSFQEWVSLVKKKRDFEVIEMDGRFREYSTLGRKFDFAKKNSEGEPFVWNDLKVIQKF